MTKTPIRMVKCLLFWLTTLKNLELCCFTIGSEVRKFNDDVSFVGQKARCFCLTIVQKRAKNFGVFFRLISSIAQANSLQTKIQAQQHSTTADPKADDETIRRRR